MQEKNILKTPVRYLKGVGPKRSRDLGELNIRTVEDLFYYLPRRYEDRSKLVRIRDLRIGQSQLVRGEIIKINIRRSKSGISMFEATLDDGSRSVEAVWFNQPYLKDYIRVGDRITLYGKVELYKKVQIISPEYEIFKDDNNFSFNLGRIVPIYLRSSELTQKYLRSLIFQSMSNYTKSLVERIPEYVLKREQLADIKYAVNNIHFPVDSEALNKAYKRIVFEEFFLLQIALAIRKRMMKIDFTGSPHALNGKLIEQFKKSLPFEMTSAQKNAISDIERDMSSAKPMNRLLEGDVGSGKTVVAAHALILTVENAMQGVIMAPTEVLARQHFIALSEFLMPLGINVELIVGGMSDEAKKRIQADVNSGKIDILVGTHAVIQGAVVFKKLGLAVIDEQHKFGVKQRLALKSKGDNPHILIMTATPIPRTLALTVYGDLDISAIKELPKGRKPIVTYWVDEDRRSKVYNFIREEIGKGRQAFIICPRVNSPEKCSDSMSAVSADLSLEGGRDIYKSSGSGGNFLGDLFYEHPKNVIDTFEDIKNNVFKDHAIGLIHGKMTSVEKETVMKDFKKGKIKILVSTIVIEVGIDVPNATVMLIENADRFGLSQLHQLRGRVGRGAHESYCILLANPKTESGCERLKTIERTLDGFEIAQADLDMRGSGEFFGSRQHGLPEIRFGDIVKDFTIMEGARREAFNLIERDPDLKESCHRLLREALVERFKNNIALAHVT